MLAIVLLVGQVYPGSHVTQACARDCPAAVIPYVPTQVINNIGVEEKNRFERRVVRISKNKKCTYFGPENSRILYFA